MPPVPRSSEPVNKPVKAKRVGNPNPMGILEFSRELLNTSDLDPIYTMIHRANMPMSVRKRWVLAYSCFYHAGVASYCAEKRKGFYDRLREGHDKKYPRGAERRHFRGGTSDYVTNWLRDTYPEPEDAVNFLIGKEENKTFKSVTGRVKKWKYFGPWIAFKWADLLERVLMVPVDFSDCHLDIYEAPKQGAELVAKTMGRPDMSVKKVVRYLEKELHTYRAPPTFDRPVNVQEIETCLCKWKSHCNGHYPIGKDTHEITEGLEGWGDLADHLVNYLPELVHHPKKEHHDRKSVHSGSRSLWVDNR